MLPIEFTLPLAAYGAMGGHLANVTALEDALRRTAFRVAPMPSGNPWPVGG